MTLIIIIIIIIVILHWISTKKGFTWFGQKELIKISQKIGKVIYLYKAGNTNFLIMFKILPKLQKLSWSKVKQNLFGEYMFSITLKDSFLGPKFLVLPQSPHARGKFYIYLERDFMPHFSMFLYYILTFGSSGWKKYFDLWILWLWKYHLWAKVISQF